MPPFTLSWCHVMRSVPVCDVTDYCHMFIYVYDVLYFMFYITVAGDVVILVTVCSINKLSGLFSYSSEVITINLITIHET